MGGYTIRRPVQDLLSLTRLVHPLPHRTGSNHDDGFSAEFSVEKM